MYPSPAALVALLSLYSVAVNALPVDSGKYTRSISARAITSAPAPGGLSLRSELELLNMDLHPMEGPEGDDLLSVSEVTVLEPEELDVEACTEPPMEFEASLAPEPIAFEPENHYHHELLFPLNDHSHHWENMMEARLAERLAARDYYNYYDELD